MSFLTPACFYYKSWTSYRNVWGFALKPVCLTVSYRSYGGMNTPLIFSQTPVRHCKTYRFYSKSSAGPVRHTCFVTDLANPQLEALWHLGRQAGGSPKKKIHHFTGRCASRPVHLFRTTRCKNNPSFCFGLSRPPHLLFAKLGGAPRI